MIARLIPKKKRAGSSRDFAQSQDEWELAVFRDATHFTVVAHLGRCNGGPPAFDRQEFPADRLPAAIEAAKAPTKNGKPRLLYAVTAEGRQIVLDRADHEAWLALWKGAATNAHTLSDHNKM